MIAVLSLLPLVAAGGPPAGGPAAAGPSGIGPAAVAPAATGPPEGLDRLAGYRGLVPPPEVERAREVRARAGEVEAALRRVGGVVDVRCVAGAGRATVVISHAPGRPPLDGPAVRWLASAALGDVAPADVQVVWSEAAGPGARAGPAAAAGAEAGRPEDAGGTYAVALFLVLVGGWLVRRSVTSRG